MIWMELKGTNGTTRLESAPEGYDEQLGVRGVLPHLDRICTVVDSDGPPTKIQGCSVANL